MKFLDGKAVTAEIAKLSESSRKVKLAVAFWGDGATEKLRLGKKASVVCNLRSGGTNPHEIEKLTDQCVSVRQCDTLHGKVYLFDEHVIIGSSNASANGLALQGNELARWSEANILTTDRSIYEAAERWIDGLDVRDITPSDLDAAKDAFSRRRAVAPITARPKMSLLEALRTHPESFKDKRIYICVYLTLFGEEEINIVANEQERWGNDQTIDAVSWKVPTDARFVCFYITRRRTVRFDGFWRTDKSEWKSPGRSPLYFMRRLRTLDIISSIGLTETWAEALLAFSDEEISAHGYEAEHIELGEFYEKYLRRTEPKMKISP